MKKEIDNMTLLEFESFRDNWQSSLLRTLPSYRSQIENFVSDDVFGLRHSYEGWNRAYTVAEKIETSNQPAKIDKDIIEHIAVFHDIGKFFEDLHSLANISIAERVFGEHAETIQMKATQKDAIIDGVRYSDFYNKRLDPSSRPPSTLEGETFRAADKMLGNMVSKVDRYWYDYGVPRGATFFDPSLIHDDRRSFSFDNFAGDQLNVILSIIGLRPEDFSHPILQEEYRQWSEEPKKKVVERIISLAREIGETPENIDKVKEVVNWYRKAFAC